MKKILTLILVVFSTNLFAQQLDQKSINSVVQEIVMGEGPVTKAEYEKFWQPFGANNAQQRAQFINIMRQRFVLTQEYQREVWLCAEKAWNLKAVPPCTKAQNKLSVLKNEVGADYASAISPLEDYSTNLLKAAAAHKAIQNPNGQGQVEVNLAMIKSTREGLDRMLSRLSQVMRPEF